MFLSRVIRTREISLHKHNSCILPRLTKHSLVLVIVSPRSGTKYYLPDQVLNIISQISTKYLPDQVPNIISQIRYQILSLRSVPNIISQISTKYLPHQVLNIISQIRYQISSSRSVPNIIFQISTKYHLPGQPHGLFFPHNYIFAFILTVFLFPFCPDNHMVHFALMAKWPYFLLQPHDPLCNTYVVCISELVRWTGHMDSCLTRDSLLHSLSSHTGDTDVLSWGMQCNRAIRQVFPEVYMKRKGKFKTTCYYGVELISESRQVHHHRHHPPLHLSQHHQQVINSN